MNKTKDKEQKSQRSSITFKGDNEAKHFIIATTIEQFGNWSIKLRDYILTYVLKRLFSALLIDVW